MRGNTSHKKSGLFWEESSGNRRLNWEWLGLSSSVVTNSMVAIEGGGPAGGAEKEMEGEAANIEVGEGAEVGVVVVGGE